MSKITVDAETFDKITGVKGKDFTDEHFLKGPKKKKEPEVKPPARPLPYKTRPMTSVTNEQMTATRKKL